MINRLIQWSLRNRFLIVCGVLLLIGGVATVLMGMMQRNATEMALTNRRVAIG